MDSNTAKELIKGTFNFPFEESRFRNFAINLLNTLDEEKSFGYISGNYIKDKFKPHITKYRRLGTYTDPNEAKIDVLVVQIKNEWALERSRSTLRNFTADYLSNRDGKDAALVAYFSSDPDDWRFSYIRMEYKIGTSTSGKVTVRKDLTPAKRFSFLVGKNEPNHTAQAQLLPILEDDRHNPTLESIESAFSVERVTKQFYLDYRRLYEKLKAELDKISQKDKKISREFLEKSVTTANFAKKLMGQIIFLYFLQKKGWLGVGRNKNGDFDRWGQGPKNFLRRLFLGEFIEYRNFFNDILEPLFYEALATDRPQDLFNRFDCKIPFLNGGLFEPLNEYNWVETDIMLDNSLFEEIFRTLDLYNFTVREDEPLETEVAVDPEMLGKVFENLIEENERKGGGTYYTPREIVHYMCQESLINYLASSCPEVPKDDIVTLIREGDIILELETAISEGIGYKPALMDTIKDSATQLDTALNDLKFCDPAIGSGAFPVGMLNEIVKARQVLQIYLNGNRSVYDLKRHSIQNSLYGVDLDPGAIDIAKLRLWLSLAVDENDYDSIQPLPNLDYKIMQGNSLVEDFHGIFLDIKKKGQKDLFAGGEELDRLVEDLHEKQEDFFNAEHPGDKQSKRLAVERAIYEIFHNELLKKKHVSNSEAAEIESDLREMTHGNKVRNFFPWKLFFADIFRSGGGFDIVIANPPYVEFKNLQEAIKKSLHNYVTVKGKYDLYIPFIELASTLTKTNGLITYICPSRFMHRDYGTEMRQFIQRELQILRIADFKDKQIFSTALTYTGVFCFQHNAVKEYSFYYQNSLDNSEAQQFDKKKLSDKVWYFEDPENSKIIGDIRAGSQPLSKVVEGIYQGIATGKDKVFVIDEESLLQNKIEQDAVQPFLKGRDIGPYLISWSGKFCIYPYRENGAVINESDMKNKYPNCYAYLEKNRGELSGRGYFEKSKKKWYELWNQRNLARFSQKKIITLDNASQNSFALDTDGYIGTTTTYSLIPRQGIVTHEYLLGLLNSKLMNYYHKKNTIPQAGGYFRYQATFIKDHPIKLSNQKSQSMVGYFVNCILFSKTHTINHPSDLKIFSYFEQLIDGIVYELYFTELFRKKNCQIISHIERLPIHKQNQTNDEKMAEFRSVFNTFYDANHQVRINLSKLSSIPEIALIENRSEMKNM